MGLFKLEASLNRASLAGNWRLPAIALLIAGLLSLGDETAREWLRFERDGIRAGEIWRLAGGHFVHLGWSHFALNGAGLGLIWYLVGGAMRDLQWILVCAVCILTIDAGLWVFSPEIEWYVGLSGVLHGILAAGVVVGLKKAEKETIALAVLLAAKLAWEQFIGPLPGSEGTAGGAVVVDSHLFGTFGGILGAMLTRIRVGPAAPI